MPVAVRFRCSAPTVVGAGAHDIIAGFLHPQSIRKIENLRRFTRLAGLSLLASMRCCYLLMLNGAPHGWPGRGGSLSQRQEGGRACGLPSFIQRRVPQCVMPRKSRALFVWHLACKRSVFFSWPIW